MRFTPPRLGPGAIYLRSLDGVIRSNADLIKVAEVEPQTLWTKPTAANAPPRGNPRERRHVAALPQRLLTHGIGNPVGETICDQEQQIPEFRLWNQELAVPWTSEHLSILYVPSVHGPQPCGFLMPPLQTDAAVELAAKNIRRRAEVLGLPFAFETGVNYFERREGEMPDGEFFAAVAQEADCGILLDLTNLWVNEKNRRARISDVVAKLPLERVWEVHLAGTDVERGFWVDAHSRGIDPELLELVPEVISSLPNLGAIVFEIAPDRLSMFSEHAFLREMEKVNDLWEKAPQRVHDSQRESLRARTGQARAQLTPEVWERVIAQRMLVQCHQPSDDGTLVGITPVDEERFDLYAYLAGSFRSGAVAELLSNSLRLLLIALGEDAVRELMDRYMAATPAVAFPTDEALQFRRYMDANSLPVPGLSEMLKFEATLVEAAADGRTIEVAFTKDVDTMLADVAAGRLPRESSDLPETWIQIGVDPAPFVRMVERSPVPV